VDCSLESLWIGRFTEVAQHVLETGERVDVNA